ncbi:MAG: glycerol-3-phosphate responsive antiterminator [Vagococcus sp.]
MNSASEYILLSEVTIGNLKELTKVCHKAGKKVLVHADLIGGFKGDKEGMNLLKTLFKVDGVMSTNVTVLRQARQKGLYTIYRLFMIDSRSLDRSIHILENEAFDCVEVLPGDYALQQEGDIKKYIGSANLIAGGFVTTPELANEILLGSFIGLTTSDPQIWK